MIAGMILSERLQALRKQKKLSQGDIEKRTGLLRCYVSRVEHGHTTPSVLTLEKLARALGVPLYQLFHDGDGSIKAPAWLKGSPRSLEASWGVSGKDAQTLARFRRLLSKMKERDLDHLLFLAQKMAAAHASKRARRTG